MRQFLFLWVFALITFRLTAQIIDARVIAPPSPTAASLLKFSEVPVSKYTGLPETTVPVYTIHSKSLNLPIALRYHSGGVRVTETASWVGMGWALDFGGVISLGIRGLRDDAQYGRFNADPVADKSNPSLCDLYEVMQGFKEGEPDIYSFSVNGMSGEFFLNDNKEVVQIPQQKLKIEAVMPVNWQPGLPFNIDSWKITDQNGVQYFFAETEAVTTISKDGGGSMVGHPAQPQVSWYLSKVVDPVGNTINFSYDTYSSLDYALSSESRTDVSDDQYGNVNNVVTLSKIYQGINVNPGKHIRTISWDGGRIEFITGGNRCDLSGDRYLSEINVYNNNQRVKKQTLNYKYFVGIATYNPADLDCSSDPPPNVETSDQTHNYYKDRRLFLTSVDENDNTDAKAYSYTFDYENSIGLPNRFSAQQDWWGLYNGNGYTSLIQNLHLLSDGNYDILGRDASLNYAKQGVLTKITYPTGGYSQFDFNLNAVPTSFLPSEVVNPQVVYSASGESRDQHLGDFSVNDVSDSVTISFQVQRCVFGPTGTPAAGFYIKDDNGNMVVTGTQVTSYNQQTGNGQFSIVFHNGNYHMYSYAVSDLPCSYNITIYQWTEQPPPVAGAFTYGGLMVNKVTSYDPTANSTIVDNYEYYQPSISVSLGAVNNNSITYQSSGHLADPCLENTKRVFTVSSNTNYPLGTNSNGFVGYGQVIVKRLDSNGNDLGYTLTQFSQDPGDFFPSFSMQASTTQIASWAGTHSLAPAYHFSWARGKMLKNYQFVNSGNNIYRAVHTEDYYYSGLHLSDTVQGIASAYLFASQVNCTQECFGRPRDDSYYYTPYQLFTGYQVLDSVVKKDIDDQGRTLQNSTSFVYDTSNLLPSRTSTVNSKNETTVTYQSYPMDYQVTGATDPASLGIQNLQNLHVIASGIEKFVQRWNSDGSDLTTTSAVMNTYKPAIPFPDSVFNWEPPFRSAGFTPFSITPSGATRDINYKPRVAFNKYDSYGNLQQQNKVRDINLSYIWDYQGVYPIAEIKNASFDQSAYTSFEADGTGNWVLNGTSIDSTSAITGRRSCLLNGSISRSGLNSGSTYIVSYWMQTSSHSALNIPGTISGYPVVGKTAFIGNTAWTLFVHKVTGQSVITLTGSGVHLDELRLYPATAQMTTYAYAPLIGMTSQTDPGNRVTYYEYDGLARLKRIRDQDYNIVKSFEYQYQAQAGCGNGCAVLAMQTLAGTNTIGYPVGVFNVHGELVGNAAGPDEYVSRWNSDTANAAVGTLAKSGDSLHFNLTLNMGKAAPTGVTGCRYFQYDIPWTNIDGIRAGNGQYVDFGDGTGMHVPKSGSDTPAIMPPNTTKAGFFDQWDQIWWFIHNYPDSSVKTITFYHSDQNESTGLDNAFSPANSLKRLRNFRGNVPQNLSELGTSCLQQSSASSVAGLTNWNSISTITQLYLYCGDGSISPYLNVGYVQDFMKNNRGLQTINTSLLNYYWSGCRDTAFRLTRLKTNWNTYFTQLQDIEISDEQWNREDLSALTHLKTFVLVAGNVKHSNNQSDNPITPIPSSVIDGVINQIAAGSGSINSNGSINILPGGTARTSASDAAVNLLKSKGWTIYVEGVLQ